jgi:hypothetical protein
VTEQRQSVKNLEVSIRGLNAFFYIDGFLGVDGNQKCIPAGIIENETEILNEPFISIDLQQYLYASPSGLVANLHCKSKTLKYRKGRDCWELYCVS